MKKLWSLLVILLAMQSFCLSMGNNFILVDGGGYARNASMGAGGFGALLEGDNMVTFEGQPFLADPINMLNNPAWMTQYGNYVWMNIGDPSNNFAGANIKLADNMVFGVLLTAETEQNLLTNSFFDPGDLNPYSYNYDLPDIKNNFEILYAFEADMFSFGAGISYGSYSIENKPDDGSTTETSFSQLGINAGIIADITPNMILDAGVLLSLPSYSNNLSGNEGSMSATIISVNGRMFIQPNSNLVFVPIANFYTISGTIKGGSTELDLTSSSGFDLGIGINYSMGDFLFIGGTSMSLYSKTKPKIENGNPELSSTEFVFPRWNLGMEWKIAEWLYGRLGYVSSSGSITEETGAGNDIDEYTQTVYNKYTNPGVRVGLGFRFGNFGIDATVNQMMLTSGFGNFSGDIPSFGYLSAFYTFKN